MGNPIRVTERRGGKVVQLLLLLRKTRGGAIDVLGTEAHASAKAAFRYGGGDGGRC